MKALGLTRIANASRLLHEGTVSLKGAVSANLGKIQSWSLAKLLKVNVLLPLLENNHVDKAGKELLELQSRNSSHFDNLTIW